MEESLTAGRIEARVMGDGPLVVLLHSLPANPTSHDFVIGQSSRSFRVMLPAFPGFGRSPVVEGGCLRWPIEPYPRSKN
jgi:pimeloyl-ACP methyl ester carboxylesterase